jgi:hypothetical protein
MQAGYRRRNRGPAAGIPQLLVLAGCSLVAFTGVWLWWFAEDTTGRVIRENDITDPYAVQLWMRRLHWAGAYVVLAVVVYMILRAAMRREGQRMAFLFVFLIVMGVGVWSGYTVDWDAAQLWSETVGTKLRIGLDLGDGPRLPEELGRARLHLSVVPAAILIVGLASFLQYRRR